VSVLAQRRRFKRYTVRLGDLRGAGGNPFAIQAQIARHLRQQEVPHDEIEGLLQSFGRLTYTEMLTRISEVLHWADEDECGLITGTWVRDDDSMELEY